MINFDILCEKYKQKNIKKQEKLKRNIESGLINGKILSNGTAVYVKPKGIQNWYSARELVEKVTKIMNKNEKEYGIRRCHVNVKWCLQIRGKHLRRLLKAMPNVKQNGNWLIEQK